MTPTSKRKKPGTPESIIPGDNISSYLLMKHADQSKTLNSVSPFLIEKTISSLVKDQINIKKLKTGAILIETKSSHQTSLLLQITSLQDKVPVVVTRHPTMNNARGVLRSWALGDLSNEEIQEYFQTQGVVDVRKLSKTSAPGMPTYQLTFENKHLPDHINILSERYRLEPYYPPPLRCHNCLVYGHGVPCNKPKVCPNCAQITDHDPSTCTEPIQCAACHSPEHDVRSSKCPKYISERQAIRLSYQVQIPIPEARIHVKKTPSGVSPYQTYSSCLKTSLSDQNIFPLNPQDNSQQKITNYILSNTQESLTPSTSTQLQVTTNQEQQKYNTNFPTLSSPNNIPPNKQDHFMVKKQPIIQLTPKDKQPKNDCKMCEKLISKVEQLTNQVTELTKVVNNLLQTISGTKLSQDTNIPTKLNTNNNNTKSNKNKKEDVHPKISNPKPNNHNEKHEAQPKNKTDIQLPFTIPDEEIFNCTFDMDISNTPETLK